MPLAPSLSRNILTVQVPLAVALGEMHCAASFRGGPAQCYVISSLGPVGSRQWKIMPNNRNTVASTDPTRTATHCGPR